ncbi:MAG: beta-galactosidase family protein [Candidatus Nanopelagicales bacterium]
MNPRPTLSIEPDGFRMGGEPFRLLGGAMHYFRVRPEYWRDRLTKLVDLGANTVETYVAWNAHEPKQGEFDFEAMHDIVAFTNLADELGLHVIIRPGPYICAEWDLGGLPNWLLADPDLAIRCSDPAYLAHVDAFFDVLIPLFVPLQATHGGPLIALQIENEYGYYGNDRNYLLHLRDGLLERGIDVPLFTSDGTYQTLCVANGGLDEHLRTANFGSGAAERFEVLRAVQHTGPLACMEFWVGWFDSWGDSEHHTRPAQETAADLGRVLEIGNASVNIYMFHGGTNWGLRAGGNLHERFLPFVTSYDYDALLTEWGDTTPKYDAFREVLHRVQGKPLAPIRPARADRRDLGTIHLTQTATLTDALPALSTPIEHATTRSMEKLGTLSARFDGNGFVLYRTTLSSLYRGEHLLLRDLHDWAHVLLDGKPLATVYRNDEHPRIALDFDGETATLDILVAHLARSNFNYRMAETKGITGAVTTSGNSVNDQRCLFGWTHYPLSFDAGLADIAWASADPIPTGPSPTGPTPIGPTPAGPSLHRGTFTVASPADTFLYPDGFTLGCAILNGVNLGRYWEVGPQRALYVPAPMLRAGENELILFEAVGSTAAQVSLRAEPSLNG